jgi:hypothetical protein
VNGTPISSAFVRRDPRTGKQSWRYDSPGFLKAQFAIHPDGTIFATEVVDGGTVQNPNGPVLRNSADIVALNGSTGTPKFTVPIPTTHFAEMNIDGCPCSNFEIFDAAKVGRIIIGVDGAAYVSMHQAEFISDGIAQTVSHSQTLEVLKIFSDGTSATIPVHNFNFNRTFSSNAVDPQITIGEMATTNSGIVFGWGTAAADVDFTIFTLTTSLTPIDSSGAVGADINVPFDSWNGQGLSPASAYFMATSGSQADILTQFVPSGFEDPAPVNTLRSGENNVVYANNGGKTTSIDLVAGPKWSFADFNGVFLDTVLSGGILVGSDAGNPVEFDASGTLTQLGTNTGIFWEAGLAHTFPLSGGVAESVTSIGKLPNVCWCIYQGNLRNQNAPNVALSVSFEQPKALIGVPPGSPTVGTLTVDGTPPNDGTYTWEIVAAKPEDDAGVISLTSQPACAGQGTCVAGFSAIKPGSATLRVHFKSNTTGKSVTDDARITVVKIEFQKLNGTKLPDILRVGKSTTTLAGKPHDRTQNLRLQVTPASEASNSFVSRGNLVGVNSKQSANDVVPFDVVGLTDSLKDGDGDITAIDGGVTFTQKVSVVEPMFIRGTVKSGTVQGVNRGLNVATSPALCNVDASSLSLVTVYGQQLSITVLDNLTQPVGDLYAGAEVTESPNPCGSGDVQTNLTVGADGTYSDPVTVFTPSGAVVPIGSDQANAWGNQNILPITPQVVLQNITVKIDGQSLTPALQREVEAISPNIVNVIDKSPPQQ